MILLLFGAPGCGKGTQSSLLVSRFGFFQISTGDLLRNSIRNNTLLGRDAKSYMDKGHLVPDDVVIGLVEEILALKLEAGQRDFIFDGFPRTVGQAERLESILNKFSLKANNAVFINVDRGSLVTRLTGRRTCPTCGAVYHITNSPSKKEGICDKCGGTLVQRSDDREDVIVSRLSTYDSTAELLKKFYVGLGIKREVNGDQAVELVFRSIVSSAAIKET